MAPRRCAPRSEPNGSLRLDFVRKVCEEIGVALREISRCHVVVIRSTILPGTTRSLVIPALAHAEFVVIGNGAQRA